MTILFKLNLVGLVDKTGQWLAVRSPERSRALRLAEWRLSESPFALSTIRIVLGSNLAQLATDSSNQSIRRSFFESLDELVFLDRLQQVVVASRSLYIHNGIAVPSGGGHDDLCPLS